MKKTVAICTLGCKVNQYESSALESLFRQKGYEIVDFNQPARVYVINTCTVTHVSDRKSRQLIRRAHRKNPGAMVVVTGCYAQTSAGEILEIPGVDLVVGTAGKANIVDLIENNLHGSAPVNAVAGVESLSSCEELPGALEQNRVRGFLKIQEGCDNYCAYCIVPYARGPLRSRNPDHVLQEAGKLLEHGYKELVLTGIHTGAYGKDLPGSVDLAGLVRQISSLDGLERLRLSSLEPQDVDFHLVDTLASSPHVCRHFHLPLQSGDDEVLQSMRRRYDTGHFRSIVNRLREKMPGSAITTDVMVGFPGETRAQFENTVRFVEEMQFAGMHVFKYSPRRGTAAATFPDQVEAGEKDRRNQVLLEISRRLQLEFISQRVGKNLTVLVEQYWDESNNLLEGYTDNYIKVVFPAGQARRGDLVNVKAEKANESYLAGRII